MTTLLDIGLQIQEERELKKLAKSQLASLANVDRNRIQQLESGLGNVSLSTLLALCDSLDLSVKLLPKELDKHMTHDSPTQSALQKKLQQIGVIYSGVNTKSRAK